MGTHSRWGEPPSKAARERTVAVRMKQPAKTFQTTPENVGKENSLYPAWLEKFRHVYEGPLFTETDLPIERVKAVLRTLPYAETWRWRVLLPPQGERSIISDCGLCEFGDRGVLEDHTAHPVAGLKPRAIRTDRQDGADHLGAGLDRTARLQHPDEPDAPWECEERTPTGR